MFLLFINMFVGRVIIGAFYDWFLRSFVPPWSSGIDVPYMQPYSNEYSGLSGQLMIIPLSRYVLKFDVTGQ